MWPVLKVGKAVLHPPTLHSSKREVILRKLFKNTREVDGRAMSYLPHASSGSRGRSSSGASYNYDHHPTSYPSPGKGHSGGNYFESGATKLAILEADVNVRSREVETLRTANREQKDRYEHLLSELVRKNKQVMEEASARIGQAETQNETLQRDNESLRRYIKDLEGQVSGNQEALGSLESHSNHQSLMHRQLISEVESLRHQLQVSEKESSILRGQLADAGEREEDVRCDLEDAQGKLERADRHIQLLSDEVAAAKVQAHKTAVEVEDIRAAQDSSAAFHKEIQERVCRAVFALAEEMEEVMHDCDELSLRTRLALKESSVEMGVAGSPKRSPTTSQEVAFLQEKLEAIVSKRSAARMAANGPRRAGAGNADPAAPSPPPRCLPEDIYSASDLAQAPPAALVKTAVNIVDMLTLARDDIAVTLRAVEEEGVVRSRSAVAKHVHSFRQAIDEERESAQAAVRQLNDAEDRIRSLTLENDEMKIGLAKVDTMMKEAEDLSEERAKRLSALAEERDTLRRAVERHVADLADSRKVRGELEQRIEELKSEIETSRWLVGQKQDDAQGAQNELKRAKESLKEAQGEIQALKSAVRDGKRDVEEAQRAATRAADAANDLRSKLAAKESLLAQQGREIQAGVAREHDLEDQLAAHKRQLDAALRTSAAATLGGTSAMAMLGGSAVSMPRSVADSSQGYPHHVSATDHPTADRHGHSAVASASPFRAGHIDKVSEWSNRLESLLQRAHSSRREGSRIAADQSGY